MIRGVVMTLACATASENEGSSLLQLNHNSESESAGTRIWEASRKTRAGQDVCLPVTSGQRAPIAGTFKVGDQVLNVQPGDLAKRAGVFCVPKNTVAMLQRSLGLETAKHMDKALLKKDEEEAKTCDEAIKDIDYPPIDLIQMRNDSVTSDSIINDLLATAKATIAQEMINENVTQSVQDKVNAALAAAQAVNTSLIVSTLMDLVECEANALTTTGAPTTTTTTNAPERGRAAFCHEIRYHADCIATDGLLEDLHNMTKPKLKECNSCEDIWTACGFGKPPPSAYGVEETTQNKDGR